MVSIAGADGASVHLILDDVEKVTSPDAQAQLDTLIRYAPDNLHIALGRRSNLGLSLAHLSLIGQVNRFEANGLRFTHIETNTYLQDIVSTHDMDRVAEQTEGWPVVLGPRLFGLDEDFRPVEDLAAAT